MLRNLFFCPYIFLSTIFLSSPLIRVRSRHPRFISPRLHFAVPLALGGKCFAILI